MSARLALVLPFTRRLGPIMAAQVLGAFNDNLFRYALVTLAAYSGVTIAGLDEDVIVPIAATAFTLPIFLFSAVAGQVADRYPRSAIMRRAKLAEIPLMALAAAGFLFGEPIFLLLTLFFMGVQSAFFIPARQSAMPVYLADEELVAGNALVNGFIFVAILMAAALGQMLIGQEAIAELGSITLTGPGLVGAILIAVAALGYGGALLLPRTEPAAPDLKVRWNIITETARMLGFLGKAPDVLRPLLGVAWFWMMSAAVITLIPLFMAQVIGANETALALVTLIFVVGSAVGSLACAVFSRGRDALGFTLAGAIGVALFAGFVGMRFIAAPAEEVEAAALLTPAQFFADRSQWPFLAALFLAAMFSGLFVVPLQAMAQRRAEPALRARLLAAGGIMNAAAASIGQFGLLIVGRLDAPLSSVFLAVALGSAGAAGFVAWRLSLRRARPV